MYNLIIIDREEKSAEEKFHLDAKVREEAERLKEKLQKKAADVSFLCNVCVTKFMYILVL